MPSCPPPSCASPDCRKPAAPGRAQCHACRHLAWRTAHPLRAAYCNLRTNARRRDYACELTYEEFCALAVRTEYATCRGRYAHSATLDRIDSRRGYTLDNLQVVPNRENARKQRKDWVWDGHKMCWFMTPDVPPDFSTIPF